MPAAKAAVTAGSVVTAIPEITAAAAIPAAAMEEGVTAVEVVATEASPLAPVDYPPRRLFRFIPVWAGYQFGIASKRRFFFCIRPTYSISKSSTSPSSTSPMGLLL